MENNSESLKLNFDPNIKINPPEALYINTDEHNAPLVFIKRHGKTISFPTWQFWQVLEEQDKKDKSNGN